MEKKDEIVVVVSQSKVQDEVSPAFVRLQKQFKFSSITMGLNENKTFVTKLISRVSVFVFFFQK